MGRGVVGVAPRTPQRINTLNEEEARTGRRGINGTNECVGRFFFSLIVLSMNLTKNYPVNNTFRFYKLPPPIFLRSVQCDFLLSPNLGPKAHTA